MSLPKGLLCQVLCILYIACQAVSDMVQITSMLLEPFQKLIRGSLSLGLISRLMDSSCFPFFYLRFSDSSTILQNGWNAISRYMIQKHVLAKSTTHPILVGMGCEAVCFHFLFYINRNAFNRQEEPHRK